MQRFLARRLVLAIITLFAVSVIVFAMARIAGDPRTIMLGDFTTRQQYERTGERLGLDKPYYEQYWIFLTGALRGDFGTSTATTAPVTELILQRLAATLQLAGVAFLFSIIMGVPLGVLSAVKRGSILRSARQVCGAHRPVRPIILDWHYADLFLLRRLGVGAFFRSRRVEQHLSSSH